MSADRIASLLASSTEILHGLGLWDRVVAVSHECDYPPDVDKKPRVTFTNIDTGASSAAIDDQVRQSVKSQEPLYRIDVDRLAGVRPDLIVTQAQCDVCAVKYDDVVAAVRSNKALRGTTIIALNPGTMEDIFKDIKRVGEATGAAQQAERFIRTLRDRVAFVQTATDSLKDEEKPRTVCIEWIEPVMVAANWMPDLLRIAGGRCDLTSAGQQSGYTKWEDVVAYDPEVIVVMPCGFDLRRTLKESRVLPGFDHWSEIAAVRKGRVFAVDGNAYFNRAGPRIVDSLEILTALLHPDRFAKQREAYGHAWCAYAEW